MVGFGFDNINNKPRTVQTSSKTYTTKELVNITIGTSGNHYKRQELIHLMQCKIPFTTFLYPIWGVTKLFEKGTSPKSPTGKVLDLALIERFKQIEKAFKSCIKLSLKEFL